MDLQIPGLFIAGTDTNVGKTYIACLIARTCVEQGFRVAVYKPVLSGSSADDDHQGDDFRLWDAAGRPGRYEEVCPQKFTAPLAPHLAAWQEGKSVDEHRLVEGITPWCEDYDLVIVEGAGGLMSPISDSLYVADLAAEFRLPLIVVAPNRLGVINQTLQTLIAACTFRDGLSVAGVVLNEIDAEPPDESCKLNADQLQLHCVPPVLGCVEYAQTDVIDAVDWLALATSD